MAISIREAMELPVMSQTQLVAGSEGLNNMIKWVTIVEIIEDINRLQEGEFLITTGFGLTENEKRQNFHKLLQMEKLSGVAIHTGFYLQEIPEAFIDIANKSKLPLIEIPSNLNFSMITKEILQQIVNNQMQLLEYSFDIHKKLTGLVLQNRNPMSITQTLAALIHGSIVVYTEHRDINHHHIVHSAIELHDDKTLTIHHEAVPLTFFEDTLKLKRTLYYNANGFTVAACPIVASEMTFGHVIAIKESAAWEEMDNIALQHAASVYAIEYLKQRAIEETHIRLQGDFLEDILQKRIHNPSAAIKNAKKFGLDLSANQAVLNIKMVADEKDLDNVAHKQIVSHLYCMISRIMQDGRWQFIVREKTDGLIVLATVHEKKQNESKQTILQLGRKIQSYWQRFYPQYSLRIGIGRAYKEIDKLVQSASEAEFSITCSELLPHPQPVVHFDDIGMYQLLFEMKEAGIELRNLYEEYLRPFIQQDDRGQEMLLTLETYFLNNQNIQKTASELYIHRHTLRYRLEQIEKKGGFNLDSVDERMKLLLAIMAYKLTRLA